MSNVIVLGAQWGDEGKGKIMSILTPEADFVVRYQGGPNAGRTLVHNGIKTVLHLMPSGIFNPRCVNIIGNGCVIDPGRLILEISTLQASGIKVTPQNLLISHAAHVITDEHVSEDLAKCVGPIGSTGRGIGPCYRDKIFRVGRRMEDLDNDTLKPFIRKDIPEMLNKANQQHRTIVYEGAQGSMLDVDHGDYPFVTSSNCTIGGAYTGSGVYIPFHRRLAIVKAYSTRIGTGPFPTEQANYTGERLREIGAEYGATTGRPRRCGWLDLHLLKKATITNGFNAIALTKIDCLSHLNKIPVAIDRDYQGNPLYDVLNGWEEDISGITEWNKLPSACRDYVSYIEDFLTLPISIVSTGADRNDTIFREDI